MRLLTLLLFATVWPSVLTAQFKIGPLGGFSSSHVDGTESLGSRLGTQAGLLFSLGADRRVSLEGDVYFAMKGSGSEDTDRTAARQTRLRGQMQADSDTTVSSIHLNYAEIPILVRLNLFKNAVQILGGPSVAIRLACAVTLTSNLQVIQDQDCDDSGDPLVSSADWSAAGGIGLKLSAFELNLRAVGSLGDITRSGTGLSERFKNVTYSLTGRLPFKVPGTGSDSPPEQ